MAANDKGKSVERAAVTTTIVGGRPPGCGQDVGAIPCGIEILVKKAAVDPAFRTLLVEHRSRAAAEIGLALAPAEAAMLDGAPKEQLEKIIAATRVRPDQKPAFLGKAAALMVAALGLQVFAADGHDIFSEGIRPGRPPSERGVTDTFGDRPDRPSSGSGGEPGFVKEIRERVKEREAQEQKSKPAEATAPASARPPQFQGVSEGARPDRPRGTTTPAATRPAETTAPASSQPVRPPAISRGMQIDKPPGTTRPASRKNDNGQ